LVARYQPQNETSRLLSGQRRDSTGEGQLTGSTSLADLPPLVETQLVGASLCRHDP
jgi:hypothetical protein